MKLETTTIYTKVAVRSAGRIESPLDAMTQPQQTERPRRVPEVGRMTIDIQPVQNRGVPAARVRLVIANDAAPVELGGIVVKETRPGWLSLDLPPLEAWAESMKWLTPAQRERIESPKFYQLLQREVTRRYLARIRGPG